ncbi:MAG: hypothetical protein A3J65_00045 [Candidatus Buchananbacteria bacterium RIFCSPHIGHO2_02_FULL_45_11b]|uniref:Uncharacterized protein n=3 Tax=Candidatus Buchananiibacteriota TaxID=1817903 RepID=A0A1G1YD94_9BACT|nr:MAG: hypothetical protein A2663_04170 [Candidatus Buchananbacteria bacterium RIFCSPHIGHO2_01_FULL_46_12]OGY50325.1 MAG: hypothetical protein A3J65_00045 [Candidatus Buchananbacteria bacterium RIFCSPHIGHO2_02_FULL_45_11b]OGY57457.1 MAG: hypothetical protein A3H67_02280 [Candidatus Buchananbacteria bacterium RIFCSPLOWO2_02_FULL_46_11b]
MLFKKTIKQKNNKAIKQKQGFSLPEALVSLFIITLLMLAVLPNFRAGQRSQEIDVNLKQLVEGITSVRTKSLAGQLLVDPAVYPAGTTTDGYGIRFIKGRQSYESFAVLPAYAAVPKPSLPNNPQEIGNIKIISLSGLVEPEADKPFPLGLDQSPWQNLGIPEKPSPSLEIIFSLPNSIMAVPAADGAGNQFKYVGGMIEHVKSGRRGYFYVSLLSGAVNYGLY